jgi:hypothetical protein
LIPSDDSKDGLRPSGGIPLRESLTGISTLLAGAGVVIYGILSFGYNQFYGALGLVPGDVGLNYPSVLANAGGFVVEMLLLIAAAAIVRAWLRYYMVGDVLRLGRLAFIPLPLIAALLAIVFAVLSAESGIRAAQSVKEGQPVGPIQSFYSLGLTTLAIRADSVNVQSTDGPRSSSLLQSLQGRVLLYLGQANGNIVLYDADLQRTIFLPQGSVEMALRNCRNKRPKDHACNQS